MAERSRPVRGPIWFASIVFYVVLLTVSHIYQSVAYSTVSRAMATKVETQVLVDGFDSEGRPVPGREVRIFYHSWPPDETTPRGLPVLLLHGSPGDGGYFDDLASELTHAGRTVIAPDLPGYGDSDMAPDQSFANHARMMHRLLDEVGIDRAHVVGWSSGGAVAMHMAEQDPARVASLSLLGSIGAQETEGSGSYFFEHTKYAVGIVLLGAVPEAIPHFGLLGSWKDRTGWLWSFWDSDQRDLGRIMPGIATPTLIIHGRHDSLVADWAAEHHHQLLPASRLVMLETSHFFPVTRPQETSEYIAPFLARHDPPGVAPQTGYLDLAPVPERGGINALVHDLGRWIHGLPWWLVLAAAVVLVRWRPVLGVVIVTLPVALMRLDFGVALPAIITGRAWWLARGAGPMDRPWTVLRWIRAILFALPAFAIGAAGGAWTLPLGDRLGAVGLAGGMLLTWTALKAVRLAATWEGRQRIKGWLRRCGSHEYWPTAVIYAPVLWWGLGRVLRGKALRPLTAVNPGYAPGGGVQGESKHDINAKMGDDPSVLHCDLIAAGADRKARADTAIERLRDDPRLGGYPVICKPDHGERGRAVKLIRDDAQLAAYCHAHPGEPVVMQRYHPGPIEVGVLWVRSVDSVKDPAAHTGHSGFIYAVTIKHFPVLTGNGRHTIRRLILAHPRHRAQARVFLERMAGVLHEIPAKGETVSLGFAGNHAQGAMFTDGRELVTDALTDRINTLIERFTDSKGGGFDIGRFDLRCASLEGLSRGEGFGIVELNGLTSEPTNLYDPRRSIFWAWGQLLGYWKHAEALADARILAGTGQPADKESYRAMKRELVKVMLRQ